MQVILQTEQLIGIYISDNVFVKSLGRKFCLEVQLVIETLEAFENVEDYATKQFLDYKPPLQVEHFHSVQVNKELRLLFKVPKADTIVITGFNKQI